MKAETADTIFRELLRRSSADGLNYLREQLAAHEAKGYGLAVPGGEALRVEWKEHRDGLRMMRAAFGDGLFAVMCDDEDGGYDVWLMTDPSPLVFLRVTDGMTVADAQANTLRKLPAHLAALVTIGRAAARALRGETGE